MKPEIYQCIIDSLPHHPLTRGAAENWHGFWVNGDDEIMCQSKEYANAVADFFEDAGVGIMHTYEYTEDGEFFEYAGWWCVYVDGQ